MTSKEVNLPANAYWPTTRHDVSLGLGIPDSQPSPGSTYPRFNDLLELSETASAAGFDMLWFADHFSFPSEEGLRGSWDAWTLLAAIAARVPDVFLGPMVACTGYRNPGVIAKMTEMIDEMSGGRFILGLGAGWQRDEYDQFGLPFEPRVSRFEEAIRIIHGLLRHGEADLQGTYYQANGAKNLPRGPRPEGAPILVGSSSPRMLGLLATYGDAWDTGWGGDTDGLKAKVATFEKAMKEAGRDPSTVVRSVSVGFAGEGFTGDPATVLADNDDEKVALLESMVALGFGHLRISLQPMSVEAIEAFAPVIKAFYSRR
jgi:alkanesulfonate monooxygenase SsuD/methylene tetrahydromethanopterin reductase-like flavin-dependent oxidoreductase (luciferase family)